MTDRYQRGDEQMLNKLNDYDDYGSSEEEEYSEQDDDLNEELLREAKRPIVEEVQVKSKRLRIINDSDDSDE